MNAGRQLNFLSYPPSISVSSNLPSHTQHQSLLLVPRTVLPYQSPLNLPNTHQTPPNKYLANPRPTRGAAPPFIRPLRKTSTQTNIMCWADQCGSCKKMTWAGCGKHIDNALKDVNLSNRCPGWSAGKSDAFRQHSQLPDRRQGQAGRPEEIARVVNPSLTPPPQANVRFPTARLW